MTSTIKILAGKNKTLSESCRHHKRCNIQMPFLSNESELEFKYIVFKTNLDIRKLIIKNMDKILVQNINNENNEYAFYLDTPLNSKELKG